MRIVIAGLAVAILCLVTAGETLLVAAQDTPNASVTVINTNQKAIVVAFTAPDFQVETVEQQGARWQRILMANTTQTTTPGAPQTPSAGVLLGVPTLNQLAVKILEADYETVTDYQLAPAPQIELVTAEMNSFGAAGDMHESFVQDAAIYGANAFYPVAPATLGEPGLMRDQAVVQLQFSPVQYNPVTHATRIYRRIVAKITWDAEVTAAPAQTRPVSPAYEKVLQQTLANYATLARPTATPSTTTNAAADAVNAVTAAAASATSPLVKIGVTEDGLYQVTEADLRAAGFDLATLDPRTFKLHQRGVEIPIFAAGEVDGHFDVSDTILFYGTAITDLYTTQNVYWLSAGGGAGLRMAQRDGTVPNGGAVATHFPVLHHAEQDISYWQNMLNGPDEDRWFWGSRLSPNTQNMPTARDYSVALDHISTQAITATLHVRLKGYTSGAHHSKIYLNNQWVDDQRWQGQVIFDHEVTTAHALLVNGNNVIKVEAADAGATVDQLLVNWMEIKYWDTYAAAGDQLRFGAPAAGAYQFTLTGFNNADIWLIDISEPNAPKLITPTTITPLGGEFQLQFGDNSSAESRYLALTPTQWKTPASMVVDQASTWKSPNHGADYIIIAYDDFYTSTLRLAEHRQATGLRVATVKVGDLYDEFNDGIFHPQAIRNFLAYAYQNWQGAPPTYVLLVGDAYQDYRDYLQTGTINYVPSQIIHTNLLGETSSDNWFVAFNGADILPDMLIGRLATRSSQEVDELVNKIIDYEQNPPDATWNHNVLFVADDDDAIFADLSQHLAERLPYYYSTQQIAAQDYPPGNPTTDIQAQINSGNIMVNYAGHGAFFRWGQWNNEKSAILGLADIDGLTNAHKLPLVTIANCLNGFFTGPKNDVSIAEKFQRLGNGAGAIAVWAPTDLGYPSGHRALLDDFYDALFLADHTDLGSATTMAKLATYASSSFWGQLVETYVLFGDPATHLAIPTNYPYLQESLPANSATAVAIDQAIQLTFNKPVNPATIALNDSTQSGLTFTPTWNTDNTVVTYAHADFAHGRQYGFNITGADKAGNLLGAGVVPASWSFTVTSDATAPTGTVQVSSGADGPHLAVVFSEPVRTETVVFVLTPNILGSWTWDETGQRAAFAPANGFAIGQSYRVRVVTAKDLAGNTMLTPIEGTFSNQRYLYLPLVTKRN